MSRRDTIIIAVLVNTGLLAVLFMLASTPTDDLFSPEATTTARTEQKPPPFIEQEDIVVIDAGDNVDQVLQEYVAIAEPEPIPVQKEEEPEIEYLKVTVKRGDALEKIARHNKTTVAEIKKANNLQTDRLRIGQILRIPVPPEEENDSAAEPEPSSIEEAVEYYIVQEGDNPWKIAKKFGVGFNKLLELNNLDEAKARKMRAGDKLRVK